MKRKALNILICVAIILSLVVGVPTALAEDSAQIPAGYVITDGVTYYWIQYDDLLVSYLSYRIDPNSPGGALAKFYFDTLGGDVMNHLAAYVSGQTMKFVSFEAVLNKYIETRDVDATYIWFNSSDPADATPAFDVITQVVMLGPDGTETGSVYVGIDGYIITLAGPGIVIPGVVTLRVEADTTDVYVNLGNPTGNPCYFVISLKLEDSTVLYESDLLAPGDTLGYIELSEALAQGEYNASILYEAFALDDLDPLNSAEVLITLVAQ